jgi:multicomponent Na+:H+ antiporter subunit F
MVVQGRAAGIEEPEMNQFYLAITIVLLLNTIPCIYQAIKGPTIQDTIISINILNTKAVVIMLLLSAFFGQEIFLDVSFVFAFLYFVVVYGTSRYIEEKGGPVGKLDK